jgi:MoaA/NifB/PqqE/SkfB family radical SAM enzyme
MCNIWQNDGSGEMSLNEWERVMDDEIFQEIKALTLSGGEPVLTKNFEEKVKVIVKAMPQLKKINIITNGFSQDLILEKAQFLLDFCQQKEIELSVSVSLDGVADIHEKIRRIPNAFEKTYGTIKKLQQLQQDYDFQIGSGAVLMKQTIDKAGGFENWARQHNLNLNFQIVGFHDTFVNNLERKEELDFEERQGMDQFLDFLKQKSKPKSLFDFNAYYWADMHSFYKNGTDRSTPCPFLQDQFVLDCRGDVFYCLSEPAVGNVFKEERSVGQIYYDPKNLKIRKQRAKTACKRCNSGCNVNYALAKDLKKYGWYYLTGKLWRDKNVV